jgi:hypothetical protein
VKKVKLTVRACSERRCLQYAANHWSKCTQLPHEQRLDFHKENERELSVEIR